MNSLRCAQSAILAAMTAVLGGHSRHKTQYPNSKYPDLDLKYPYPHYLMSSSDSESYYPNLYWVIRVSTPGTRTTQNRNTSQRSAKSRIGASPISRGPSPTTVGVWRPGLWCSFVSRVKLKHKHWCDGRQQAWCWNFSICSCILSVLSSQYLCRRSGLHLRLKIWMRRGFTCLHLLLKTWSYHFIGYELMSYHLVCPVLCKILWCLNTCCDFIYFEYIGYTRTRTRTCG
jgi:hypothetical protein